VEKEKYLFIPPSNQTIRLNYLEIWEIFFRYTQSSNHAMSISSAALAANDFHCGL